MRWAAILAGGKGERLWPLSREGRPKQLATLTGGVSMIRLTVDRILPIVPAEQVLVITSADLADGIRKELPDVPAENIIGEPVGKNSAPAVALAAHLVHAKDPDGVILVAPADHIVDPEGFRIVLDEVMTYAASADELVTFGIHPTRAETGYGYIERGESLAGAIHRAVSFREKPDASTAKRFLRDDDFLWNSGMFVWRASVVLDALKRHAPDVHAALDGVSAPPSNDDLVRFYDASPSISIDYALMEPAKNVAVHGSDFHWCDVGSWAAMGEVFGSDGSGNTQHGRVYMKECEDTIAFSDGGAVALLGVENAIVVSVDGITLVCAKDRAGEVRDIVRKIRESEGWEDAR